MDRSHRLKLDRAVEHLYAIEAAAERWSQTNPCMAFDDCDIKTRHHRIFIEVERQPNDPLILLRVGDCIHNLRQSLDHLAYQLAIVARRADPPPNEETTGFPIVEAKPVPGDRPRKRFDDGLAEKIARKRDMPPGMYTALEGLQPYHGGDRELLAVLSKLDNLDKHRSPPVVAGVALGHTLNFDSAQVLWLNGPRGGAIERGTPVIEYIPVDPTKVNMQFHFQGGIAFGESMPVAAGELILPLLSAIRLFILREVFPPLEPCLL